ncbi:MAG: hypothetical protein R3195_02305 [Gemmatimonadota bacterium]|nr:hypothetical protein [Gemmatimonadota bacterium]
MSDAYETALARHGLEDVQPLYRQLLLRLKKSDASAYDEAVERYRSDVEACVGSAEDPVEVWVAYGAWLAPKVSRGALKRVNREGRADEVEGPVLGPMLIHVPEDARERAILIAMPSDASPAQRETAALLCG